MSRASHHSNPENQALEIEAIEVSVHRERLWRLVRAVPFGATISYGELGARLEPPVSGYVCGRMMALAPEGVPWWRVVAKDGALPIRKRHPELAARQRALLEAEGVRFDADNRVVSGSDSNL